MYNSDQLRLFVAESNLIEGITRDPSSVEIEAAERVLSLDQMTTPELCRYQWVVAPGNPLRVAQGMDVRVGRAERALCGAGEGDNIYVAPPGGPNIRARLDRIIGRANAWCAQRARRAERPEIARPEIARPEIASAIEDRVGDDQSDRVGDQSDRVGGNPFDIHIRFALLHPFMTANGRAGRMLWLWQMRDQDLQKSFLHQFYYQTLANTNGK